MANSVYLFCFSCFSINKCCYNIYKWWSYRFLVVALIWPMNRKLVIIIVEICGDSLCANNSLHNHILLLCTINQCFVNKFWMIRCFVILSL